MARRRLGLCLLGLLIAGAPWCCAVQARDFGQWMNEDPVIREWYQSLMQPDNPAASCCGEADAYWCDIVKTKHDHLGNPHNFCIITDRRSDMPRRRVHVDVGTEIEIPNHKMKRDQGNPTGHNVVFLSRGYAVYCFVMGTGL